MAERNKGNQILHPPHHGTARTAERTTSPIETNTGVCCTVRSEELRSEYREYRVRSPLKVHLMCLWTQSVTGSGNPYAHRVLPDGCVDIVFINDDRPVVAGPYMECFIASLPPGARIVGARFHPGRASGFLGHPASALLNQLVPLDAIWSNTAYSNFLSRVFEATGFGRLAALETALISRISQLESPDAAVVAAIKWLADHPEERVEQLSHWIGMSSRQLGRRFSAAVGYCPKVFQEVLRFQSLLNLATQQSDRPGLATLSAEAGYADQAHMSREVHRFSDMPPTHFLKSAQCTLRLSGLI